MPHDSNVPGEANETDVYDRRVSEGAEGPTPRRLRVLMLVASSVPSDVRVLREAEELTTAGHHVVVLGRGAVDQQRRSFDVIAADGGPGLGRVTRPRRWQRVARWLLLPLHRARVFDRWAAEVELLSKAQAIDVVHAHDFTALAPAVRIATTRRVPFVYDSHEWWQRRHRVGRPSPMRRRRETRAENRWASKAAAVITVTEPLAAELRGRPGWPEVVLVRNTCEVDEATIAPQGPPRGLVYAGRLGPGRDLETVARASRHVPLPVVLRGPADPWWRNSFDPGCCELAPPVEPQQIPSELADRGLALITLADSCDNHRVAVPNKLYQAVRAGVPVVASDVGEMARLVRQHGLGTLFQPGSASGLVAATELVSDGNEESLARVRAAATSFDRGVDRRALLGVYERLATSERAGVVH